jgi:hypothetical protein
VSLVADTVRVAATFAAVDAEGRGCVTKGSIRLSCRVNEFVPFDDWDAGSFYVYI